jgi:hypothetical protein
MKLKGIVSKPPLITLLTDLAAAIAAGLSAGLVTAFISAQSERKVNSLAQTKLILLALVSYLVIALLLHWFWTGAFRRVAPKCILICILGSLLFVTIRLTPGIIDGWNAPSLREKPPLSEYISTEISAALSVIIFLSIVTLPVAAIVTYIAAGLQWRPVAGEEGG